ncbi:MAG: hypothetical protein ABIN99_03165 [Nitrosospira sp.]
MNLARSVTGITYSLFFLVSCASLNPGAVQNPVNGSFQITKMGPHHAQFQFSSRNAGASNPKQEIIEVSVEEGEDIQRAVARKMTDIIRQYQKGDFWWESYRLDRTVVLSASMEDSKGLEDFLMREFFMSDQSVEVDPRQANHPALNPKATRMRGGGLFEITSMNPRSDDFQSVTECRIRISQVFGDIYP